MQWDISRIDDIVNFINSELINGITMKDIEKKSFDVNERVIHKRLLRLGYKKIENQYVLQKYDKCIQDIKEEPLKESVQKYDKCIQTNSTNIDVIEKFNKLDINVLLELQELIDPIKVLFDDYKKRNEIIEVKPIEISIKKNTVDTISKSFRIDKDVAAAWDIFIKENSQYKVQDLISLALSEFMDKYKKNR